MILGVLVVTLGIVGYISYVIINQENVIRDGEVFEGTVRIENTQYVYTDCEISGKTKKIAEIDNWDVYEISEDSKQIFLKMKSVIGEQYIVREDYQIPASGKVNCAYIDGERVDDEDVLEALTHILLQKNTTGTLQYIYDKKTEKDKWKSVVVGYEDCPVGTDYSVYGISKIDSKWVVVFQKDVENLDGDWCRVVYHEVDGKDAEAFEDSKIWMR